MNREAANCEIARRLAEAGDPDLAQHLVTCPSCIMRNHAPYYEAPAGLDQKILQRLRREDSRAVPWRWLAIAASVLLALSLTGNLALLRSRVDPREVLVADVLSAHVRSLAGTHLLDVPSSDQHTVKPWFNGKLDFAPNVKDVDGFPLLGGRVEYFDGHAAAALVYGRRQHVVNLFIWPATRGAEGTQVRNGYNLENWSSDGMTFWAVSDLNVAELHQFMELYRQK